MRDLRSSRQIRAAMAIACPVASLCARPRLRPGTISDSTRRTAPRLHRQGDPASPEENPGADCRSGGRRPGAQAPVDQPRATAQSRCRRWGSNPRSSDEKSFICRAFGVDTGDSVQLIEVGAGRTAEFGTRLGTRPSPQASARLWAPLPSVPIPPAIHGRRATPSRRQPPTPKQLAGSATNTSTIHIGSNATTQQADRRDRPSDTHSSLRRPRQYLCRPRSRGPC